MATSHPDPVAGCQLEPAFALARGSGRIVPGVPSGIEVDIVARAIEGLEREKTKREIGVVAIEEEGFAIAACGEPGAAANQIRAPHHRKPVRRNLLTPFWSIGFGMDGEKRDRDERW